MVVISPEETRGVVWRDGGFASLACSAASRIEWNCAKWGRVWKGGGVGGC